MFNIKYRYVDHEQTGDKWLKWRSEGIGASEVVVLAGLCPHKTQHRLYLEKKGLIEPEDLSRNPHIVRGNRCEPKVRDYLISHFDTVISVACAEDANNPHRKVSFDGVMLVSHNGQLRPVPVEIKSPCASVYQEVVDGLEQSKAYKHHIWQVQYQMAMLNAPFGYLVFYCEVTNRMKPFTVQPDIEMQRKAIELIDNFYFNHMEKGVEPPLDPERDVFVLENDRKHQWFGMAAELLRIKEREAELKKEMDLLKVEFKKISNNLIEQTQGFKKVRVGNIQLTRVKPKDSFDYRQFVEDKGIDITPSDLDKYTKSRSVSFRLSLYDKDKLKAQQQSASQANGNITQTTLEDITRAVSLSLS